MIKNNIAAKLIVVFLAGIAIVFLPVVGMYHRFSRKTIERSTEQYAQALAQATGYQIDNIFSSMRKVPEVIAMGIENKYISPPQVDGLLRKTLENNPEIFGMAAAFEKQGGEGFASYVCRRKNKIEFVRLDQTSKGFYVMEDWYQIPKEIKSPCWSEPYYDETGGKIIMATYSVPCYRIVNGKKEFYGVVTADISLEWLRNIVSSIRILKTGFGFLLSRNGMMITHPAKDRIMNETIFSVAEEENNSVLRDIGYAMIEGKSGFAQVKSVLTNGAAWIYYSGIPSTQWSVAVVFPENELMADVRNLNRSTLFWGSIGFFALGLMIVVIARTITRPLRKITANVALISQGQLNAEIASPETEDEIGTLVRALQTMQSSLKKYIAELQETTKAKEHIESQLSIAREIQMSMLPEVASFSSTQKGFDLFAQIEPAQEVGGDFYDFFWTSEHHVAFAIGDVSGKGVPAALFMAITKTLLKAKTNMQMDPGEILFLVNNELCQGNSKTMFATIFFGILDVQSGEVRYANGGHNLPLLLRRGDSSVSFLPPSQGFVVGAMENRQFETKQLTLSLNDILFLYTDGVSEALNNRDEFFGNERLQENLKHSAQASAKIVVHSIFEAVHRFSRGIPPSDDIAVLAVQFLGGTKTW